MGQYYKKSKIGTCEAMYYMRLEEAEKLASMGAKDDDGIAFASYITDEATFFRFPFPTEDGETHETLVSAPHDKCFVIPAGGVDVGHQAISLYNKRTDGSNGMAITIPCPHSSEYRTLIMHGDISQSYGGAGEQALSVRYQAIRDGKEKTLFECARCGQLQRFDDDDIAKIKARATEYFAGYDCTGKNEGYNGNQGLYDYAMEIIKRIK